jgi:hypothetical protein
VVTNDRLQAYLFETADGALAVVWSPDGQPLKLQLGDQTTAQDMTGNLIERNTVDVVHAPLYLSAPSAAPLVTTLREFGPSRP